MGEPLIKLLRGVMQHNEWLSKVAPVLIGAAILGAFSMGFNHETRLAVVETLTGVTTDRLDQIDDKLERIEALLRKEQ